MLFNRGNRLGPASALAILAVAGALPLSLFCSRSDVITGAGGRVVGDIDPALIDHSRGFATVTLDGLTATDSSFSLPAEPDPLFGTYYDVGDAPVGVSEDGDMLAAHFQYRVIGGSQYAHEIAKPPAPYAPRFDSAFICFRTVGKPSSGVSFFYSDTLPEFAPVNRSDTARYDYACDACGNRVGATGQAAPDTSVLMALPHGLGEKIYGRRMALDTTSADFYAFSVPNYADSLLWIRAPYIIVRFYVRQYGMTDSILALDTIRGLARYTAFETAGAAAARRGLPYSSQFTRRTAVFRVDVGKMADTLASLGMSGDRSELLNAVAAVWHIGAADTAKTGLNTRDGGSYKAVILDNFLEREAVFDSNFTAVSRPLRSEFEAAGATELRAPEYFNTHSFRPVLRSVLGKYNRGEIPKPYIYIYLRPVSNAANGGGSAILWRQPLKIDAVFTPSSRPQ